MTVNERLAERNRELRARYQELVPKADRIDGLTILHTYKMRDLWGRPFEFKAVVIAGFSGFFLSMILNSFMRPVLGWWGGGLGLVLGFAGGWIFSGRFLIGDGVRVKNPHQRKEQRNLIANTVSSGPVVPPEDRYQFIRGGVEASLETYLVKEER